MEKPDQQDRWLSVEEAADLLQLSPTTIYRFVKSREVPHYRVGRAVRFDPAELKRWAKERFAVAPVEGAH